MTTRLEDQLTVGMHDHAAGARLSRDVLAAATHRHRRRTAVHRAVSVTGTAGLVGAVAATVALTGGSLIGGESAVPPSASGATEPVRLNADQVAARVAATLTDTRDTVQHVRVGTSMGGRTSRMEMWHDHRTGDYRLSGSKVPGAPRILYGMTRRDGQDVMTTVHHDRRVWWRYSAPTVTDGKKVRSGSEKSPDMTPEGIRRSLEAGDENFVVVGREKLDGRSTLHVRLTFGWTGTDDLWVDAKTYQLVRRVVVRQDGDHPKLRVQEDYEWLERTPKVLSEVRVSPPEGYREVSPPQADPDATPKG